MTERVAGAILAGGQATRLGGMDKGLLQLDSGQTLIEHLADQMRRAGVTDIILCANEPGRYERVGLTVVADVHPGVGPLGGIEAALAYWTGRAQSVLFCPCDLPGMSAREFTTLIRAFADRPESLEVVYAQTSVFFWHPLCAVVHNEALDAVRQAVAAGTGSVRRLWRRLGALGVAFDDPAPFFNLNTPEDLAQWTGRMIR